MKTLSSIAVALSLALAGVGAANAATTATVAKKPAVTCVATATKPCPVKHASMQMHKKHKIAQKSAAKTDVKKPAVKKS